MPRIKDLKERILTWPLHSFFLLQKLVDTMHLQSTATAIWDEKVFQARGCPDRHSTTQHCLGTTDPAVMSANCKGKID